MFLTCRVVAGGSPMTGSTCDKRIVSAINSDGEGFMHVAGIFLGCCRHMLVQMQGRMHWASMSCRVDGRHWLCAE